MTSTRRRRLRAHHEREALARESSRRRDAVAHSAPAGHLDRRAQVAAARALLVVLVMIAIVLTA